MKRDAVIDESRTYRYLLTRTWNENEPPAVFIMLNPSTADAEVDDPTIRRCITFAKAWKCGGLRVVNVFAYRATDPKKLLTVKDPIGPENQKYICETITNAGLIIAAWGSTDVPQTKAFSMVKQAIENANVFLHCLGTTKHAYPRHPLYLRNDTMPKLCKCDDRGKVDILSINYIINPVFERGQAHGALRNL